MARQMEGTRDNCNGFSGSDCWCEELVLSMSAPRHGISIKLRDRRAWHNMSIAGKVRTKRWLARASDIAAAEIELRTTNLLLYGHSHPELFHDSPEAA